MSFLPRFMLLKSNANGKFLCYGKDKLIKGGAPTTNLTFSHDINWQEGVGAADQLVVEPKRTAGAESSEFRMIKFEVEEAKTALGLVHIRTCYNNKYWVRKSAECNKIVAEAHKPEEDQSKWDCTLFKPILVKMGLHSAQHIQLMHVNQHYVSFDNENDHHLSLGINNALTTFTVFDVEPAVGVSVIDRQIVSATYDLQHSRVYDTITLDKYKESISNYTSVVQNEKFMVQYVSEHTMSWNQSLTGSDGITVRWSYGIPMVDGSADSSVVHVANISEVTLEWGKENVQTVKKETVMHVAIPSKKKVTVRVVATKSYCDVPFTCEVRDFMTDGTTRVYTTTGLFTGCNEYNVMQTTSTEDL